MRGADHRGKAPFSSHPGGAPGFSLVFTLIASLVCHASPLTLLFFFLPPPRTEIFGRKPPSRSGELFSTSLGMEGGINYLEFISMRHLTIPTYFIYQTFRLYCSKIMHIYLITWVKMQHYSFPLNVYTMILYPLIHAWYRYIPIYLIRNLANH